MGPDPKTPTDAEILFGFFNEIGIIAQLSGNAFERAMPESMTLPQFSVLNHMVRLGGGWSPLRIANAMQVTKGAMTNTLQHLERKDLIEIEPDEKDGRAKQVFITEAGRAMREQCIATMIPYMSSFAQAHPPAELAAILPTLQEIRAWLDKERD